LHAAQRGSFEPTLIVRREAPPRTGAAADGVDPSPSRPAAPVRSPWARTESSRRLDGIRSSTLFAGRPARAPRPSRCVPAW